MLVKCSLGALVHLESVLNNSSLHPVDLMHVIMYTQA